MIYFIADTHFGDENIILFENRPFKSVVEMNEKLISNWNNVVKSTDTVYMLGDFSKNTVEDSILDKLNGHKILVKGNHDDKSNCRYRELGFEEVYDKPIIIDNFWILSHEPMYMNRSMPYVNIFGHVHNSPLYKTYSSNHFCVCVERIDYTPISFDDIKQAIMNINKLN